jgi:CHAD domain-containing protein
MAKASGIPGLEPSTRFGDAAALTVEVRAGEVFAHAESVLDISDIERVHDMRVATRRLRAAMEVFAACFPAKEHKRLLKEVKRLADALGERRDPDVALEELDQIGGEVGRERGLRSLTKELRAEQERANRTLAAALQRVLDERLAERLAELAQKARA